MRRALLIGFVLILAIVAVAQTATLQVMPTTTLAAETGNNTSASNLFTATTNGDIGASNVSKVDTHTLMYPGFAGKIYAHLMGWFCMNSGSTATGGGTQCGSHIQVGYNSNDPAVVHAQVTDMISRGFDGVIHDWYGPGDSSDDLETRNYMAEAQLHPNFTFALMVDKGAIEWFSCYPNCTATQALLQITTYAANTFFSSPNYMRMNGRPVLTNFGIDDSYTVDWNYVAANTPGNPVFLFQDNGGFTHTATAGAYSWVMPWDLPYGDTYLSSFYSTGMQYPALYMVGAMYKGFNDTIASWSANRIMDQQCSQTWLQTFAEANSMFNGSNPLDAVQLVTWDDYEEGTELETGIDNCFSVTGSLSGTVLSWSISGNENTIDHYTVFVSTDGQNLMSLGDVPAGTHQMDLSTMALPAGAYTMYVKAVGKPSLLNHMSAAVSYTAATPPATTTGSITGTVTDSATHAAIGGATVSYIGGSATTSASGAYLMSGVPAGNVSVTASAAGYSSVTASVSVTAGATATQNVSLTAAPVTAPSTGKTVTISASPSAATIARGQSAQFQLAVSQSGASDPVLLSCGNLPAGMSCGFSATTVTPTTAPATVLLSVSAAQTMAAAPAPARRGLPMYALWMSGFGVAGLFTLPEALRRNRRAAMLAILLGLAVMQLACGGGGVSKSTVTTQSASTSASTYTVTVNATSGTVVSSTGLTITVH